jgi:y4mF family transcriptional regulator
LHPKGYNMIDTALAKFVKEMRKKFNLTQTDLAAKSGVGLRFVRDLEQGKQTLRMDKINQVLTLLEQGKQTLREVGPVEIIEEEDKE